MKNLFYIMAMVLFLASCSAGKESKSTRIEIKKEKLLADKADIRKAIESRRFILKFERMYFGHGQWIDLRPRANFLVVDGSSAIMSSAYLGSYMSALPIQGIKFQGSYEDYEVKEKVSRGVYEIRMKVVKENDSFDLYMTIGENGNCSTSVNALKINNVRYTGSLFPIDEVKMQSADGEAQI